MKTANTKIVKNFIIVLVVVSGSDILQYLFRCSEIFLTLSRYLYKKWKKINFDNFDKEFFYSQFFFYLNAHEYGRNFYFILS